MHMLRRLIKSMEVSKDQEQLQISCRTKNLEKMKEKTIMNLKEQNSLNDNCAKISLYYMDKYPYV